MAAWRYSASTYTPRDRSASRDSTVSSKYGYPSSLSSSYTASERPSRWSSTASSQKEPASRSNSVEEHGPVWAKTSLHSNPSSIVQRLKDRYAVPDTPKTAQQTAKRTETKDLSLPLTKTYGRSSTTNFNLGSKSLVENKRESRSREPSLTRTFGSKLNINSGLKTDSVKNDYDKSIFTSRASFRTKSPEPEKSSYEYRTRKPDYSPIETKPKVYTSSSLGSSPATSRYLSNKSRSGSSTGSTPNTPTTPSTDRNYVLEKFEKAQREQEEKKTTTVIMVTRGTSPSLPSASIYVRTRRADSSKTTEKPVQKPDVRPIMFDKESQVDDAQISSANKFSTYSTDKVKVRPSYGITSYTPISSRYSGRTSTYTPYSSRYDNSESRRSMSRDNLPSPSITATQTINKEVSPVGSTAPNQNSSNRITPTSPARPTSINTIKESPSPSTSVSENTTKTSTSKSSSKSKMKSDVEQLSQRNKDSSSSQNQVTQNSSSISSAQQTTNTPVKETATKPSVSEKSSKIDLTKSKTKSKMATESDQLKNKGEPANLANREKSNTPSNSEGNKRSRSKTQESDTSISVSGFSETSHSKLSSGGKAAPKHAQEKKTEAFSESESESDETATTTDSDTADDVEELTKSSEPSSIKRSITNFLQNIPNTSSVADLSGSRSRLSIFRKTGSAAKIKFKHLESGERAWWMDSSSDVPEGVTKLMASNKSINSVLDTNSLTQNLLINRQYSKDKDWLKNSNEELSDRSSMSPMPNKVLGNSSPILKQRSAEMFLEVPKLPILRQWSDEKPWWQIENEKSSKENSISRDVETSSIRSRKSNCDIQLNVDDTPCDKSENSSQIKNPPFKLIEDDVEDIDVTPALRRRREQQQAGLAEEQEIPDYQMKYNRELEDKVNYANDKNALLQECKLECSVRDLTQKLAAVANGLSNTVESNEDVLFEAGEMSGMISKAKAGLKKSQTKPFSRQTSEDLPENIKDVEKSEIDGYWKELVDSLDRPLRLGDLDFTDLTSEDEIDMVGNVRLNGMIPPPPPPFMTNGPVPAPPSTFNPPPPLMRNKAPLPPPPPIAKNKKTVKLFWKEVTDTMIPAKTDDGTGSVWDELYSVSLDCAKLEHLFESKAKDVITKKQQDQNKTKAIVVLDNKRSNAINIGMTKLPPPRAIKAAILKMDSSVVTKEGIEKLLNMLPTEEERVRIEDAQANNPEIPLGSAEQFLLTLASISELEARLKLWAFKMDYENNEKEICEPLLDLKQGVNILRNNRTFRGILSTLLSIGNFLNGQEAKGFQIEYLSKVPEVKDTVNKHSLLHHLCVFVMEKFPDSTDLYSEIGAVVRASKTDFDELAANIKKVEDDCKCSWNHLKIIAKHEGQTAMKAKMSDFLADCAERIILIGIVHRRIMCRFHKFVQWLGMPMNRISTTRPHELFKTIAEFSLEYRTTRERILQQLKKVNHHREKSRSRCNLLADNTNKKLNSKEAREDAKLRQLLSGEGKVPEVVNQTATWKRHKKRPESVAENKEDDSEILETLIKTAKQSSTSRETFKERRRSRILERKACS